MHSILVYLVQSLFSSAYVYGRVTGWLAEVTFWNVPTLLLFVQLRQFEILASFNFNISNSENQIQKFDKTWQIFLQFLQFYYVDKLSI